MTTYTALSDSQLQLDKPVIESIARAGFRDNLQAIVEGDASVPVGSRIQPRSISSAYFMATRASTYTSGASLNTAFKVPVDTEVYDPGNLYDAVTNYRFTPDKAGLYRVRVDIATTTTTSWLASGNSPSIQAQIYKNGSLFAAGISALDMTFNSSGAATGGRCVSSVEALVQMNGSTDYLEAFCYTAHGGSFSPVASATFMAVGLCQS